MSKSTTDIHWNQRAESVADDLEVNIMDIFQREIEYDYVGRYLDESMTVLEVGCGNGYSTERFRKLVRHVDAFDYSDEMIRRARQRVGETNNRFLHDNVLAPASLEGPYDAVICVRVLINLANLAEQKLAVANLAALLAPAGRFILAEGFTDGFERLNELRGQVDMPPLQPAKINFYSALGDLRPVLDEHFDLEDEFHLGMYDYLTRVVYPLIVGPDNAKHNTVFSERCAQITRALNPDDLAGFSRLRGLVMRRKPAPV